jgi:hypothetical protein
MIEIQLRIMAILWRGEVMGDVLPIWRFGAITGTASQKPLPTRVESAIAGVRIGRRREKGQEQDIAAAFCQ